MFKFDKIKKWWKNIFIWDIEFSPMTKKISWAFIFIIIISLILTIDLFPGKTDLKVGQVNKNDIEAPRTITFIDEEKTEELKQIAARSVGRVYEEDKNANKTINQTIKNFFSDIKRAKEELALVEKTGNDGQPAVDLNKQEQQQLKEEKFNKLVNEINDNYPEITVQTIKLLLKEPVALLNRLEAEVLGIMGNQMKERILPEDLPQVKDELARKAMELDLKKEHRLALSNIMESTIKPNMILDEEATRKKQEEAMKKVTPKEYTVRQGEMIIRKGDVVTEEDIKILEALGLQKPQVNYLSIFGVLITIITMISIASLYFYKYKPDVWDDPRKLIFLELMVIIVLILAKIIDVFPPVNYFHLPYLVPVAMASILITVLIGTEEAVISTIFIGFLAAIVFNNDFNVAITGFVGGLVGIYSVSKLSQRNDMVRAGFYVSGIMVILVFGLRMMNPVTSWLSLVGHISMGILNGVIVAILANGLLPYLENLFGLTSSVKLLELSNPSQPLLKRLLVESPGTYHHCVIVGNLSETAADNIGADSLLARVGSYYHDIGKMKRPYFFIENQYGGDNPHDKLSANLSALIIKSHVKDGVEMAKKYRLPQPIIEIIKQHHGTNLISLFYKQAKEDSKYESIEESDFRYEGPKPQSKEAAIIMLADITEAAVRSKNFNKTNHNRIEGLVRELIKSKLIDGQLDECELSLSDLDVIAESFVKVLTGIYHQRLDYPDTTDTIIKEMKRADKSD